MSTHKTAGVVLASIVLAAAAWACRGETKRAAQDAGGGAPETVAPEAVEPEAVEPDQAELNFESASFVMHLRLERTEHSKDHNVRLTEIHAADTVVSYGYLYEGFPPDAEKTVKKHVNLSPADLDALIALVEEKKLDRNIEEKKPADEIGVSVAMTLEITRKGKTTRAAVSGMTSIWGKELESNIRNAKFLEGVEALVSFVESRL
jgi:hypothetical protein